MHKRVIAENFIDDVDFSYPNVENIISSLNLTHSCGPDDFSAYMLQKLMCNVSLPLSIIFN